MAHNPKLNVYTLKLNPKSDSVETFRDLFKAKYLLDGNTLDQDVFLEYCKRFINGIGDKEFRKDAKNKKVIGTTSGADSTLPPLTQQFAQSILNGVIEGGKYGIIREYADTDNKNEKTILDAKKAVLDKYFILLYTPLNSKYGFLLIQSYTEESIQDSLKDFIKVFFSCADEFYNIIIEPFVPQSIVDKYMKEANIKMFSFTNKIGLQSSLRNNIQIKGQTFEVEIKLKPLEYDLNPYADSTSEIIDEIGDKYFDDFQLKDCKKRAYISDSKNRKTNYDIEQEIRKIKPTIYLEDVGITPDPNTGLPDFAKIQEYSLTVLREVISEFNKTSEIHEY